MSRSWPFDSRALALVALVWLSACASHAPAPSPYGARAAAVAQKMVGVRYRYGGETPKGFDCSGLAFYAYRRAGLTIPRDSTAQQKAATPVDLKHARPGDLLFFDTSWNRHHVAIYLGDRRFVHSPRRGKTVSIESLDDEYFAKHLTGVGRFDG
jgi:cell wall-associated NlpC family hydrolase